ncbi:hypothetical protein HZS_6635 [Henneguya salminicola]|nr:hypothetical protein HZS_6635 [Henneguya salminicola]
MLETLMRYKNNIYHMSDKLDRLNLKYYWKEASKYKIKDHKFFRKDDNVVSFSKKYHHTI